MPFYDELEELEENYPEDEYPDLEVPLQVRNRQAVKAFIHWRKSQKEQVKV